MVIENVRIINFFIVGIVYFFVKIKIIKNKLYVVDNDVIVYYSNLKLILIIII